MKRIIALLFVGFTGLVLLCNTPAYARVKVITDVDKPVVLAGDEENIVVKVGLAGLDIPNLDKRLPINVAVVLDKSGSMQSQGKMERAKQGAIEVVERLTKDDIFSLIVYDSQPRVLIEAQYVNNKDALIKTIYHIHAGGSTALYGGVTFGAAEIRKHIDKEYINRVILLSDGLANVGPKTTEELAELGESLSLEGMTVTTIGVGLDYNEDLMTALADRSSGNSYFAENSGDLPRIFAEEIGEAMTLMASDIHIDFDCVGGVKPVGVLGRRGVINDQNMELTIGNLYGKHERYALFEVQIPRNRAGKKLRVARVNIEYTDPFTRKTTRRQETVSVTYHKDRGYVERQQNKQVLKEAALNRAAEVKRKAVALSDRGDYKAAASLMKKNSFALEKVAEQCDNDEEILGQAEQFSVYSKDVTANRGFTNVQRKGVTNAAYTYPQQQTTTSVAITKIHSGSESR
ncbi:VWA domain-containing protein [Candidatus Omnitrophota bacterium]